MSKANYRSMLQYTLFSLVGGSVKIHPAGPLSPLRSGEAGPSRYQQQQQPSIFICGQPTSCRSMTPQFSHLLPPSWKSHVSAWLDEDTPSFDYGGFVVGEAPREAFLLGKGSKRAVLAGTPFVDEIFRLLDCT